MASMDELLQKIASATYGREVRSSIHDGLAMCYDDGQAAKSSAATAQAESKAFIDEVQEKLDKGELTGRGLTILGYYISLDALKAAVTSPAAGDCYGVGTVEPYDVYIYDGVNKTWVNNGAIGNEGALPKGGTQGQMLVKTSDKDYDSSWQGIPVSSVNGLTGNVTLAIPAAPKGSMGAYGSSTFSPAAGSTTTLTNFTPATDGGYLVIYNVSLSGTVSGQCFIALNGRRACFPMNTTNPAATVMAVMECKAGTNYPLTLYTQYAATITYEFVAYDVVRLYD